MTGLRFHCWCCEEHKPVEIGPLRIDELNPGPWTDVVCVECRLVIACISADVEGSILFLPAEFNVWGLWNTVTECWDMGAFFQGQRRWWTLSREDADGIAELHSNILEVRPLPAHIIAMYDDMAHALVNLMDIARAQKVLACAGQCLEAQLSWKGRPLAIFRGPTEKVADL